MVLLYCVEDVGRVGVGGARGRLLVGVAVLLVDQVRLKRLEHDVAHIKNGIEWSHLLVGKARRELLLEVVL